MDASVYDVAIVGFGPSGAVAAALLGQAGHRVLVCDRLGDVYPRPRAIALDHEIMRVFQGLGIAQAIEPYTEPFTDSCYFGVDGQLIRRMTMVEPPWPQAWTPSLVFNQPALEGVLRAAVARLPNVTVALNVECTAVRQVADGASLDLRDGHTVRARYVIGCDGASSLVRTLAGLTLDDLGFDEPWLVVDVLAHASGLAKLPRTSVQYCEPDRPCTYVIGPKNHRRWEISLRPGEDPVAAATPEGTWTLLRRWITPQDGELWRQASYRFHALVAQRWRHGRVFIAGDAAHQQPPFLGQGMCQGIRDVVNLGWKLDAALRGQATDALLDSYGLERRAHVAQLTLRLKEIGAVICERDPQQARERDQRLLGQAGATVQATPRQDVLPRLECGALSADDAPGRGTLFPQPWLLTPAGMVRMDDALVPGWLLASAQSTDAPTGDGGLRGLTRLSLPHAPEAHAVLADWFDRNRCVAALVRPDHYVFGTARRMADVPGLLAQARLLYH
jgi:3-(3-hydroxy-phenyl)propionate hydroxylase